MGKASKVARIAGGVALAGVGIATGQLWLAGIGGGIAVGGIADALAPKPKRQALTRFENGALRTFRAATAPRAILYGRSLVGGLIPYAASHDVHLRRKTFPLVHCDGPITAFHGLYTNGQLIQLEHNNFQFEQWADLIPTPGQPWRTAAGPYVRAKPYLGTMDQQADELLIAAGGGEWTGFERGRGIAYTRIDVRFDPEVWPHGDPTFLADLSGKRVYDPRSQTTGFTDNAALVIADWLMSDLGYNASLADINLDFLIEAANICDEMVPVRAGTFLTSAGQTGYLTDDDGNVLIIGEERRYTINGLVHATEQRRDQLAELAAAMAGSVVWSGGQWIIRAGAARAPAMHLTDDDLAGPYQVRARRSRPDLINRVQGIYTSPEHGYQPKGFPAVISHGYEAQDGGEVLVDNVEYRYTNSASMAHRLAIIRLERNRHQEVYRAPYMPQALGLMPTDVVEITNSRLGWDKKLFEVAGWQVDLLGPISLELVAYADEVWDDILDDPTVPGDDTSLPRAKDLAAPTNLTVTTIQRTEEDGVLTYFLRAFWDPHTDPVVDGFAVGWRRLAGGAAGEQAWTVEAVGRTTNQHLIRGVTAGEVYQVRVSALGPMGLESPPTTTTVTVAPKTAGPGDIPFLQAIAHLEAIMVRFGRPADRDFDRTEVWRSPNSSLGSAVRIAVVADDHHLDAPLTSGTTWWYWARPVSTNGALGGFAGPVFNTVGAVSAEPPPGSYWAIEPFATRSGHGRNVIPDPTFEQGDVGYLAGGVTYSVETSGGLLGPNYMRINAPGSPNQLGVFVDKWFDTKPGDVWTYSGWARLNAAGGTEAYLQVQFNDAAKGFLAAVPLRLDDNTVNWRWNEGSATAPTGAAYARLAMVVQWGGSPGWAGFDGIELYKSIDYLSPGVTGDKPTGDLGYIDRMTTPFVAPSAIIGSVTASSPAVNVPNDWGTLQQVTVPISAADLPEGGTLVRVWLTFGAVFSITANVSATPGATRLFVRLLENGVEVFPQEMIHDQMWSQATGGGTTRQPFSYPLSLVRGQGSYTYTFQATRGATGGTSAIAGTAHLVTLRAEVVKR